jgi:opacity protein-like surface antigen
VVAIFRGSAMLKKTNILLSIITSCLTILWCNTSYAQEKIDYDKYLSLSSHTGGLFFNSGYGSQLLPKDVFGIDLSIGFKIPKTIIFLETGLSYDIPNSKKMSNANVSVPGSGGAVFNDSDLTRISTNVTRANFGILSKFTVASRLNLLVGGGLSYATVNASWDISSLPSCIFSKTAMVPYFKTGVELKLSERSYLGVQYNYVMLSAMGTIAANYQDSVHYTINNVHIDSLIKPSALHLILFSYTLAF